MQKNHETWQLHKDVEEFWNRYELADKGAVVLAAVSGGADSVCMLRILHDLQDRLGIRLCAFHFNHRIRENADRDEAFVRELCGSLGIPFYRDEADVPSYAKEKGLSLEEAARELRYRALRGAAEAIHADRISTAHQMEDQAETVLLALLRGSGLTGLGGIRPRREELIRPLLFLSRERIEAYLKQVGQDFVTDETNEDEAYTRNLVRRRILPELIAVNDKGICHIQKTSFLLAEATDYIRQQAAGALADCRIGDNAEGGEWSVSAITKKPAFLQKEMLHLMIGQAAGSRKDIGGVHVEDLMKLLVSGEGSGQIDLPYGIVAQRSFDSLRLLKRGEEQGEKKEISLSFNKGELLRDRGKSVALQWPDGYEIGLRVLTEDWSLSLAGDMPRKGYTKWIDYDKIDERVEFRCVRDNDWFMIEGEHRKSASAYFKDQKIPAHKRKEMPLMAQGDEVLYFLPDRISSRVKLTESSVRVLEITLKEV
ncbi:MAG: tRNA lysidine(34) synthetase TilS [Lachnospiraceae bacterium]|nr:tRNA lysidine(34) synthetase TilS [Lachnospiraceae bacterium]